MNFVFKSIFSQVLPQFLETSSSLLQVEEGELRLPEGEFRKSKVNSYLNPMGLKLVNSSYQNISVNVPWFQFTRKAVKVAVEKINLELEHRQLDQMSTASTQSNNQNALASSHSETVPNESTAQSASGGYIKGLATKLLLNLEVTVKQLRIELQYNSSKGRVCLEMLLQDLIVKNSSIHDSADNVRKTASVRLFRLKINDVDAVRIRELNICLDYSFKAIKAIALVAQIGITIPLDMTGLLLRPFMKMMVISSQTTERPIPSKQQKNNQSSQPVRSNVKLSVYSKVDTISFGVNLDEEFRVELATKTLQISVDDCPGVNHIHRSKINFESIKLLGHHKNISHRLQERTPTVLFCLDDATQAITDKNPFVNYNEYQQKTLKQVELLYLKEQDSQIRTTIHTIHVYHLRVSLFPEETVSALSSYVDPLRNIFAGLVEDFREVKDEYRSETQLEDPQISQMAMVPSENHEVLEQKPTLIKPETPVTVAESAQPKKVVPEILNLVIYKNSIEVQFTKKHKFTLYYGVVCGRDQQNVLRVKALQLDIAQAQAQVRVLNVYGLKVVLRGNEVFVHVSYVNLNVWMGLKQLAQVIQKDRLRVRKAVVGFAEIFQSNIVVSRLIRSRKSIQSEENLPVNQQKPQPSLTVAVNLNQLRVCLGTLCPEFVPPFIGMLELEVRKLVAKVADSDVLNVGLCLSAYYINQETLLQERISNQIQISLITKPETGQKTIDFRNKVKLIIQPKHIDTIGRLFKGLSSFVIITNCTGTSFKVVQKQTSFYLEGGQSKEWFLGRSPEFVLEHNRQQSAPTSIQCDTETQKIIKVPGLTHPIMLKLCKRSDVSPVHIILKSCCRILNCAFDMGITHPKQNLEVTIRKADYDDKLLQDQIKLMKQSEDFQDFQAIFSSDSELAALKIFTNNREHSMEVLIEKELMSYYAIKDSFLRNYSSYLLYQKQREPASSTFIVMPFLFVKNLTSLELRVTIHQKKSDKEFKTTLLPDATVVPENNQFFDYYMKQFTIQLEAVNGNDTYASEHYYFNTFAFIGQPVERVVALRNTAKNKHDKLYVRVRQTVKLRSKCLDFCSVSSLVNSSSHDVVIAVRQRGVTAASLQIEVAARASDYLCMQFKNQDALIFGLNGQEPRATIQFKDFKSCPHQVISLNFCKFNQKFCNVLLLAQLSHEADMDTVKISDFVTLTNQSHSVIRVQGSELFPGEARQVILPLNLENSYNNKCVPLDKDQAVDKVYKDLFFKQPADFKEGFEIGCGQNSTNLYDFINKTSFEASTRSQNKVLRLLKDLNHRINFYVIEDIYSQDHQYTAVRNSTDHYFLVSEEMTFEGIFEDQETQLPQRKPITDPNQPELLLSVQKHKEVRKIVVQPHSSSVILKKGDHSIFLCDYKGERLQELKAGVLQTYRIRYQKSVFQNITTLEFSEKSQIRNDQVCIRGIQVIFGNRGKPLLSLSVDSANLRLLERGKFDLLIKQLTLKDCAKGYSVVRIPEDTYLIVECTNVHQNIFLLKNMFLKFKRVKADLRKDFFLNLVSFAKSATAVPATGRSQTPTAPTPTKQEIFLSIIQSRLLLVRNIFIDQFEIDLSLEMDSLTFKNQLLMNSYNLKNSTARQKKLLHQIEKFYTIALISKFPKLSFILQNLKNPLNILKSIFNLRDILKQKHLTKYLHSVSSDQLNSLYRLAFQGYTAYPDIVGSVRMFNRTTVLITTFHIIVVQPLPPNDLPGGIVKRHALQELLEIRYRPRSRDKEFIEIELRFTDDCVYLEGDNRARIALQTLIDQVFC